ncbi:uncharacterized protein LOC132300197 isoform X2 [Cornus florida]|uniref:uncharacterized protein LOC132300197 isoform X2 n=1 Tax=Cornus florida TaxID=4283 RepID=UPI00289A5B1A|nr:uncharacterized protein LOC132300197 isoform X2 [Cornus florida]
MMILRFNHSTLCYFFYWRLSTYREDKLKERQSQEDEDGERDEDPAIRLYKDTHFKEQGGWAHEKAKRNFDARKKSLCWYHK